MEYGLRRYEATQRLLWFALFFGCLALAYTISTGPVPSLPVAYEQSGSASQGSSTSAKNVLLEEMKNLSFWFHLRGVYIEPELAYPAKTPKKDAVDSRKDQRMEQAQSPQAKEGLKGGLGVQTRPRLLVRLIMYFIRVVVLFLLLRCIWLVVQFASKFFLRSILTSYINKSAPAGDSASDNPAPGLRRSFPTRQLMARVDRIPLKFILHPFQRLRLILMDPRGALSSEGLMEKERRIVDSDWQILWNSWAPFRWILWLLPLLALTQAVWLAYEHLMPLISSVKDIQNGTMPDSRDIQNVLNSFLFILIPMVQIIVASVFFSLVSGLLRRVEDLYLSNLDALLYDCFLSRLPFQSGDTIVLLQALQHYFQEMHGVLKRIEKVLGRDEDSSEGMR
jgi:hypothetical protein